MRLKYYLRGIGIGLIITTVVMALTFMLHKDDLISDDEVRERARALGMVTLEESGGRDTLLNNDGASPEALNAPQGEKNDIASDGKDADAQPVSAQQPEEETPNKEEEKEDKEDKKDKDVEDGKAADGDDQEAGDVELSIVGGEYSDIVSQKLYKAGLIDDAEEFNKYLAKGGYDNLIQPGTYEIPMGADYQTIVSIITEKKQKN